MDPRARIASTCLALFMMLGLAVPASGVEPPSIRLLVANHEVIAYRYGEKAWVNHGGFIASVGGTFDVRLARPAYNQPVVAYQFDPATDQVVRDIPEDYLDGWWGLADFITLTIENKQGEVIFKQTRSWCPNDGYAQRLTDEGPVVTQYPEWCAGHPLMKGMVWGIDEGWAIGALGWQQFVRLKAPIATYTMTMSINEPYIDLFDIPSEGATQVMTLRIKKPAAGASAPHQMQEHDQDQPQQGAAVPDDTTPDPATLPDLVALPAWSMYIDERQGREYLTFAAMEWNAGPQPIVVEGFRQTDSDVMSAYQYFYEDGQPVARAPVGTLKFHDKPDHNHWHFRQFTEYTLLDEDQDLAVVSQKRSWCLAPTDPVDLTVPGAEWRPYSVGLWTACGDAGSLWVREVLPVGWGDTYFQFVSGQAFDITGLPNGIYYVQVEVNPLGSLYETDTTNNVVTRRIRIKGPPGRRSVSVRPWMGIDTENYGYFGPVEP